MVLNGEDFLAQLLETFRSEAQEHLTAIASGLLILEQSATPPEEYDRVVEQVFRETHSLKGAARAVGLREIEILCQQQESVFSAVKKGNLTLSPDSFDLFHAVIHAVEHLLAQDKDVKTAALIKNLKALIAEGTSITTSPSVSQLSTAPSPVSPAYQADSSSVSQDQNLSDLPREHAGLNPTQSPDQITVVKESERSSADGLNTTLPGKSQAPKPAMSGQTVKISSERLENLFARADDLIGARLATGQRSTSIRDLLQNFLAWRWAWTQITTDIEHVRNRVLPDNQGGPIPYVDGIERISRFLDYNHGFIRTIEGELTSISRASARDQYLLETATTELIDEIKQVILIPASSILEMYPRVARDLARDKGKSVDVFLSGTEIEIDRRILEELRDPILHLIRNSIDHGIEFPDLRITKGKPERGEIRINVAHTRGHQVEIRFSDDGGGIDSEAVRASALSKGVITADELEGLELDQTNRLIFRSGLSTSKTVTTVSGRGLGLAIVLEKVEQIGGRVRVESSSRGTTFILSLPLSLATFRGIKVLMNHHPYYLPLRSVDRVMQINAESIKTIENRTIVEIDGEPIAVVRLAHLLSLPDTGSSGEKKTQLVIITASGIRYGLLVDQVAGAQEIVVKDLGRQLRRVKHISGASITGDGVVVPVINCEDLAVTISGMKHLPQPALIQDVRTGQRNLLVVEDSITSRMLLKNILEGAGYLVETAVDGVDALVKLKQNPVDLVVSDVDMPRMNGFVLTEKIRSDPAFADLPVILVTSLDTREDREHGITVGANAYIVKSSFDQSNLLEVISRHIL